MLFFRLLEERGIRQNHVAARMGYTPVYFTRVKKGIVPLSAEFIRRATTAIEELGLHTPEGLGYTAEDLFAPYVVHEGTVVVQERVA